MHYDLTTIDGYMARFWDLVSENQNCRAPQREAWKAVEKELFECHRMNRHRTYGSFRAGKHKRPASARPRAAMCYP